MGKEGFPRFRRRKFFIDRGLQGRFVAGLTLAVLCGFLLNMALAYFLIDRELTAGLYRIHLKVRATSEIAGPILWKLGAVTIPLILAVSAAVGWFLTRRVEVPLRAFRQSVKKIAQGDFTAGPDADMPDMLPQAFASASASLAGRFQSIRSGAEGLEKSFSRLEGLIAGPGGPGGAGASGREIEDVLADIRAESAEVGRRLAGLKL